MTVVVMATALVLAAGVPAVAQQRVSVQDFEALVAAVNTVWVALAAALVMLMHLGFGMLEAGLTRAKNAGNIVAKNMITVAIGGAAYWAVGAAFAYGTDAGGLIGVSGFFDPVTTSLGDGTQVVFQLVFAATAATIVSGAVAERIEFKAYIVIAVALTAVIYPIASHWNWYGDGAWLHDLGFYDFAGSTLVHMAGGTAALVTVVILGPRIGKYGPKGRINAIPGHSMPFAVFGVLVLFFGWFGFNGGSTLGAFGEASRIGTVLLNTTIAGCFGALAATVVSWRTAGLPDPAMIGNGALAGLVGITAGPDLATNVWAMVVGLLCGAVVVFAVSFFDRIHIDDPVGATSVHLVCGALGTLLVGVYAAGQPNGAANGATISIGGQFVGVVAVFGFVAAATAVVVLAVRATIGLRVSRQAELDGLDVHEHGTAGLPDLVGQPSR